MNPVTLIKGTNIHDHSYVLIGQCPDCDTRYHADHYREQRPGTSHDWDIAYVNAATYLKVGQKIWVDRIFSKAVLNGMYSFHGSSAAYAEFWNDSFWSTQQGKSRKISRWQIWQAFVHESLHTVAKVSDINLVLPDGLPIEEVTQNAFAKLGNDGIISSAVEHSCSECTHVYKKVADVITADDPAAMVKDEQGYTLGIKLQHPTPTLSTPTLIG